MMAEKRIVARGEALKRTVDRLEALMEEIPIGVVNVDIKGKITYVNKDMLHRTGYLREELVGKNGFRLGLFPRETLKVLRRRMKEKLMGKPPSPLEMQFKRKDGTWMWVEMRGKALWEHGVPVGIQIVAQDITERKRMEHALNERVKELQSLYSIANIAERPGITLHELCQEVVNLLPASWQYPEITCARITINGKEFKTRNYRETEWRQSSDIKAHGAKVGTVEVGYLEERPEIDEGPFLKEERLLIDAVAEQLGRITERKRMEKELQESKQILENITDGIAEAILLLSKDFEILWANKTALEQTGYEVEEVLGKYCYEVIHLRKSPCEPPRDSCPIYQLQETGKPVTLFHTHFDKERNKIYVEVSAYPIKDERGETVQFIHVSKDITERKRAEEALRMSEEKFRTIFESASDTIIRLNKYGKVIDVNRRIEDYFGYKPEELIGKNFTKLGVLSLNDLPKMAKLFSQAVRGRVLDSIELEAKRKDGSTALVEVNTRLVKKEGKIEGTVAIVRDITEHKRMEEELEFRRKELEDIMRNVIDGIGVSDVQGKIIQANRALAEMHGYDSPDEVIGRPFFDFVAKEDLPRIAERFQEMMVKKEKTIKNIEMIGLKKDGSKFPEMINITNSWDKDGSPTGSFAVVHDITELKQAEEALRQSEEKYKALFESKLEGVVVMDETMKLLLANQAVVEMFGFDSVEELLEVNLFDYIPSQERERVLTIITKDMFENNLQQVNEFQMINKAGKEIWIDAVGTLTEYQGKVAGLCSFRNITERKRAEKELREAQEQLVRSEKLAAIGQLAGGVGHELRNPLGAIKNAVYYIKAKVAESELSRKEPKVLEFLDIMDDEINSSNKIISDLLGFSRVGKPSVSPTQIEKVIEDALLHAPIPENIKLTKKLDADLPQVEIDADQVHQVLANIITNAVEAMPEGGKLTIAAREKEKFLEVEIADTGCGIPQEAMDKIFDPLFTTKAKGIGLGLAVCKAIIDRHKGNIEVKSRVGKGTTFIIKLPLKHPQNAQY